MEFTQEVKTGICNEIETLKKMLDRLTSEVGDIEAGKAIEFSIPIMSIDRICENLTNIKNDLKAWQDEDTEYSESP